jgi:DNA-binding NarL/FixJ family response regulator
MSDSPRSTATPFCTAKHSAPSELVEAIDQVRVGHSYLTRRLRPEDLGIQATRARQLSEELSPRQREVLQLYAEGHPMKEIAWRLRVSVKAVEFHKRRIMESFHLKSNADVVLFALKQGLISPRPLDHACPNAIVNEKNADRRRLGIFPSSQDRI